MFLLLGYVAVIVGFVAGVMYLVQARRLLPPHCEPVHFSRWQQAGRSAELHLYSEGGHGFGMLEQGLPSDRWIEMFHEWLDAGYQ